MTDTTTARPREVLLDAQGATGLLPVCDHYCGVEVRMRKSLQLQAEMTEEFGACMFDVTLDCEDGAPVGGEAEHADLVLAVARDAAPEARVAVRVHPVDHPAFAADVEKLVGQAADRWCHVMIPKVDSVADVELAVRHVDAAGGSTLPLQVLVESPLAVHNAFEIAAHPRVQSISFGLMDFVSAHGGAIPGEAMGLQGQFTHPLVVQAKLQIASACHAYGKTPSHCVVTEFSDAEAIGHAAHRAAAELGYTRMWSIHPSQIRPILAAFAPTDAEIDTAVAITEAAIAAQWAPVSHKGKLHDRASYRYYWQVLERAHATGKLLPQGMLKYFA